MAQVGPAKARDLSARQWNAPSRLKARDYREDALAFRAIRLPVFQDGHGFIVQGDVPGVPGLGFRPANCQQTFSQADIGPQRVQELAAAQPGVHRAQHGWCQVVHEPLSFGKGILVPLFENSLRSIRTVGSLGSDNKCPAGRRQDWRAKAIMLQFRPF
jgi:hypothetical protein